MKQILFLSFFISLQFHLFAQYDNYSSGSRSRAFSDASTPFLDHWAVFNNQAAMAFTENPSIGVFVENRFGLKELNNGALAFVLPLKKNGAIGMGLYTFNQSVLFSRQKLGFAYALKLSKNFSSGIQLNVFRSFTSEYGSYFSICGELGLYFKINERTCIGVHVFNPTSGHYNKFTDERIPTAMQIGLAYQISENVLLVGEVENSSVFNFVYKGGLEYKVNEKLRLQTGVKSDPFITSYGLSFSGHKIEINISLQYHQVLDISSGISVDYYFDE